MKVQRRLALAIIVIGATAVAGQGESPQSPGGSERSHSLSRPAIEGFSPRVRDLLTQMSREEKLAVIRGAREPDATFLGQAGWIRGVPRLGIPDLRFADGPPGVLVRHAST